MPEEFDAIAFLTGDNTASGEGEETPGEAGAGTGEETPGSEAGAGAGAGEGTGEEAGEETPAESAEEGENGEGEEEKPEEAMTPEQLKEGFVQLKTVWERNLPYLQALDNATQSAPEDQAKADTSARQIVLAIAHARGLTPEQLVGVLYKGESAPPATGEPGEKKNEFVPPKMPKAFDDMTEEDFASWMQSSYQAMASQLAEQSKTQLEPLTKRVEEEKSASDLAKKVNAAFPSVSAAILQESGGLKITPEQVTKAVRQYPGLTPLEAVQLVYRKEIAMHAKKAAGPKGGKPAPESYAGGKRKEGGAASFETDPLAAAIQHLTGDSKG